MDKELVKSFVQEYKEEQEWKKRCRDNHIDFNNYFKYSGKVEEEKVLISHWAYDFNHKCNAIHEQFIKTEKYEKLWEKNKSNSGKFTKEIATHSRKETKNSIWSD